MSNFALAIQATPIPKLITHVGVWQWTCLGFMKMMTFHRVDCMYYASIYFLYFDRLQVAVVKLTMLSVSQAVPLAQCIVLL